MQTITAGNPIEANVPNKGDFANGMQRRCGAKTRAGGMCRAPAMPNGRCRVHGGPTPRGIASPHFVHGRYAKILKGTSLGEIYESVQNDPELLNLSSEIALVQTRLHQLVGKIPAEDSGGRWKEARTYLEAFKEASARQDEYKWRTALASLDKTIQEGGKDSLLWEEILKTLKSYADLIAKEQKRRMDMNALVSVDQAVGLLAEVLMAVREYVHDQTALVAIHSKVSDALTKRPHLAVALENQQTGGTE
jgi:hypothetical protein